MKKINLRTLPRTMRNYADRRSSIAPFTSGLLALILVVYIAVLAGVVGLADAVSEGELALDQAAMTQVQGWHSDSATRLFTIVTEFGGVIGVGLMTIIAAGSHWLTRHRKAALMVIISVLGALIINLTLKGIFQRERPDFWDHFVQESGYSFPSGHAMASAALAISLIFLLWRTKARWWVFAGGATYMTLVGVSRMYLGVHYPTDIIAGWCVSFMWVSVVAAVLYEYSIFRHRNHGR